MMCRIGDLVTFNPESIKKNNNYNTINYLDTSNLTNNIVSEIVNLKISEAPSRAKRIVRKGDILYSTVRPNLCHYGIVEKNYENLICSTGFAVLRANENVNPYYLYFYLTLPIITEKLHSIAENSTSAYPSIKPDDIANIKINIPSIDIQNKVANILKVLGSKIDLNNQIKDNLYKINKQLYKRWFIDYEFPNENGKPYKTSGGRMVESELGAMPESWECKYLGELVNIVNGYSYKGKELVEKSNIGMATIKNFERNGGFKLEGYKALNPDKINKQQIVELLDLVVAHTDLTQNADIIGNPILILSKGRFKKIVISMDLVKVVPKMNIYNKFFIFEILNSEKFKKYALGYVSGTTVLHLDKSCIKQYKVAIPSNNMIDKLSKIVETNYKKISELMAENQNLEQLRDTLLPKLMNGEIDLENIKI